MTIIDQLTRDEGLRLKPYEDTEGKLTIGVGRNLSDAGITQAEAEYLLGNDVYRHRQDLLKYLPWTAEIDDARFGALLNMTFNMGIGGVLAFKDMLAQLQAKDYEGAAAAMLVSRWADQVGARAHRLSKQIETGVWQ